MRDWFCYVLSDASLVGWRAYGLKRQPIDHRDINLLAKALIILGRAFPEMVWFDSEHEYWVSPCPGYPDFVVVRPGGNPFAAGYLVSAAVLPALGDAIDVRGI